MKNQYVGDINDYRKYGLLRALACNSRIKLGIFWMLTPDDGRNDGKFLRYLDQPTGWRHYDPSLYDALRQQILIESCRTVAGIEASKVIPNATFISSYLSDNAIDRASIVGKALDAHCENDLLFFDPDNGLEVKSKPCGRKNSSKFLYFSEVQSAFGRGCSLLIYQHFPYIERNSYIEMRVGELRFWTKAKIIISVRTSYVCFFLIPQTKHVSFFLERIELLQNVWGSQFRVATHQNP